MEQTPQAQMIPMATAYWASSLVYVAADMELADRLAEAPTTAAELAHSTGSDAPALYRAMRTLAGMGLFTEGAGQRFSLTPLGETLRTGTPGSVRSSVLTLAGELVTQSVRELHYSIKTGKPAFEKVFGMPPFEWLAQHPVEASMFSETMVGFHGAEPAAVAKAYDFSQAGTVIDVGGATGNLLTAILSHHRAPHGILFDLPHVVRDAPALIKARGLTDRIVIQDGRGFPRPTRMSATGRLCHSGDETGRTAARPVPRPSHFAAWPRLPPRNAARTAAGYRRSDWPLDKFKQIRLLRAGA